MLRLIFAFLFLSVAVPIVAQKQWTLKDCIDYALENNLEISQQSLYIDMYRNNLLSSKLSVLPSLNAGVNQNFSFGRSVDSYTNEFSEENISSSNASISSSVTLFNGLQQYNTIRKSKADLEAGLADMETARNNLSLSVTSAYLQILYSVEMLETATLQMEVTRSQLERTIKLVNAGSLPVQSQLEVEAQLASEEMSMVTAQNQLDMALLNMVQLLELNDVADFSIVKPDFSGVIGHPALMTVDEIFNEAVMNMPEIKSADMKLKSSEYQLAIARGSRSPQLSVSASYGTGYSNARKMIDDITPASPVLTGYAVDAYGNYSDVYQYSFDYSYITRPFSDQIRDNASASVSFGLSIPIFNGWYTNTRISNAKIDVLQAQMQFSIAERQLYKVIQQAHSDVRAALKKYDAAVKAYHASETSFQYTQQKFDLGLVTSLDFNTAKTNLNKLKSEMINAKYDMIFKMKILDFYRGVEIKL
ncbi:MAG: TolC family protein [Bacteroidales bacterium]|nr:TolC family protein [Bacteroidales bacterium]HOY37954.1 TolC family protein [Bacteroidales bacterium]HQP03189.1 TolC family protein [Bacteroidales bacterium]